MAKKIEYWARIIIIGIVVYSIVYGVFVYTDQSRAKRTQEVFINEISSICEVTVVDEDTWDFVDYDSLSIDDINSLLDVYCHYDMQYKEPYQYYFMSKSFFGLIQSGIDSLSEDAYIGDKIELNEIQNKVNTLKVEDSLSWRYEDSYMRTCAKTVAILGVIIYLLFAWVLKKTE